MRRPAYNTQFLLSGTELPWNAACRRRLENTSPVLLPKEKQPDDSPSKLGNSQFIVGKTFAKKQFATTTVHAEHSEDIAATVPYVVETPSKVLYYRSNAWTQIA